MSVNLAEAIEALTFGIPREMETPGDTADLSTRMNKEYLNRVAVATLGVFATLPNAPSRFSQLELQMMAQLNRTQAGDVRMALRDVLSRTNEARPDVERLETIAFNVSSRKGLSGRL